jgi:lysozyme
VGYSKAAGYEPEAEEESFMNMSDEGIQFLKSFEGCRLEAYQDQAGIWTIGYGHTAGVKEGDTCTQEQAERWLEDDLNWAAIVVKNAIDVPLTDNQRDALTDFVFNVGSGNFMHSTLRKKLNAGDYEGSAAEFARWNKAGGKVSKGLVRRRAAEEEMFRRGM